MKELQSKIQVITDGEYAVAKQDVDRLRLELGQQPLPSLQSTLEEKSAEYVFTISPLPPLCLFRYGRTPCNSGPCDASKHTCRTFPHSSMYAAPMLPQERMRALSLLLARDAGRRSRLSLPLGFHPRFLPPRPIAVLISPPPLPALPPHPPLAHRYLKALRLQAEAASSSAGAKRPADELGADGQPVKRPRGRPKGSKNSKPKTKPGTPTGSGSGAPNP